MDDLPPPDSAAPRADAARSRPARRHELFHLRLVIARYVDEIAADRVSGE